THRGTLIRWHHCVDRAVRPCLIEPAGIGPNDWPARDERWSRPLKGRKRVMRVHGLILATAAMTALTATAFEASAQSSARDTARAAVQASPTVRNDLVTRDD